MVEPNTTYIQECLNRLGQGDQHARADLIRAAADRLTELAHAMEAAPPWQRVTLQTSWPSKPRTVLLIRAARRLEEVPSAGRGTSGGRARRIRLGLLSTLETKRSVGAFAASGVKIAICPLIRSPHVNGPFPRLSFFVVSSFAP